MLVMTATPIPRTLLMTHYGDLDVSRLTEKPAGRKPIVTKSIAIDSIERLIDRLRVQLAEGAQVYWVCPLIESSEKSELAAAEERHAHLSQHLRRQKPSGCCTAPCPTRPRTPPWPRSPAACSRCWWRPR